jgi:hypothetical protein
MHNILTHLLQASVKPLMENIKELAAVTAGGDVRLICAGGQIVFAHRLILSLSSSTLERSMNTESFWNTGALLELHCTEHAWTWRKALAFLYPIDAGGDGDRQLDWSILEAVIRLALK